MYTVDAHATCEPHSPRRRLVWPGVDARLSAELPRLNASVFAVLPELDATSELLTTFSTGIAALASPIADTRAGLAVVAQYTGPLDDTVTGAAALRHNLTTVTNSANYPNASQVRYPRTLMCLQAAGCSGVFVRVYTQC